MAKSKAVGDPAKAGKYTSAGRRAWLLFISSGLVGRSSPSFSRSGRRPALWHQVCTKSRTAWCLCVRSPPATHIPAWWLLWSRTASHKGHHVSEAASGTWRRTRSSDKKAAGSIWVRPLGTAFKKALPATEASERSVARPVMVLWARCVSQAARSIIWDKAFCLWPRAVSRLMAWLAGSWALKAARAARTSGQAFASSKEKVASSSAAEVRVDAQDARKAAAACWEVDRSPSPPWARPNDNQWSPQSSAGACHRTCPGPWFAPWQGCSACCGASEQTRRRREEAVRQPVGPPTLPKSQGGRLLWRPVQRCGPGQRQHPQRRHPRARSHAAPCWTPQRREASCRGSGNAGQQCPWTQLQPAHTWPGSRSNQWLLPWLRPSGERGWPQQHPQPESHHRGSGLQCPSQRCKGRGQEVGLLPQTGEVLEDHLVEPQHSTQPPTQQIAAG